MIGIYALYWEIPELVYIGQSVDIPRRFVSHKYKFSTNTHIMYLQNIYTKYGTPKCIILEECSIVELDSLETCWISDFDTVNYLSTGQGGRIGYESPKCAATKQQIIDTAKLLLDPSISDETILSNTGVSKGTLESIKYRKRHSWLKEECPEVWEQLSKVKRFTKGQLTRYKTNVLLKDPFGKIHEVSNLSKFAVDNNLNKGHLCSLARGEVSHHKGWKLIENRKEVSDE